VLAPLTAPQWPARPQFMWSLGVPEDEAEFHDVYGLDEDELEMVPQPVFAVVLCFPDPPQVITF
jgi:ubiquitin carboxyl-terminal hydrolase L3